MRRVPLTRVPNVRHFLISGVSAAALTATGPVWADCAPDAPMDDASVICTGTDVDGLTVPADRLNVLVEEGATVNAGASAAILTTGFENQLNVNGTVAGGSMSGIVVSNGEPYTSHDYMYVPNTSADYDYDNAQWVYYPWGSAIITVGENATISGTNAISIMAASGNTLGTLDVQLENSGTLTGSSGPAIVTEGDTVRFLRFVNLEDGQIGGIRALITQMQNVGTISGGNGSAIEFLPAFGGTGYLLNSGHIESNTAAPTIAYPKNVSYGAYANISNEGGIIENLGSGFAIDIPESGANYYNFSINNGPNSRISSAESVAIRSNSGLNIGNQGEIRGSSSAIISRDFLHLYNNTGKIVGHVIVLEPVESEPSSYSYVDNVGGTIDGDVTLGSSDDFVIADFGTVERPIGGVTGTVDPGAGENTLRLVLTTDTVLTSAPRVSDSFQKLIFDLGADLTLDPGFSITSRTIEAQNYYGTVSSPGTLTNRADLEGDFTLIRSASDGLSFVNEGTIVARLTDEMSAAVIFP